MLFCLGAGCLGGGGGVSWFWSGSGVFGLVFGGGGCVLADGGCVFRGGGGGGGLAVVTGITGGVCI